MSGKFRRRIVEVEAWQNDDAGPTMPYWLEQISVRERLGKVRVKVAAENSVVAELGDYVVLHEDGKVEVLDPGTFGVEFKDVAAEIAEAERQVAAGRGHPCPEQEPGIQDLHEQIQTLLAAHRGDVVLGAMERSMSAVVGFMSEDLAHADHLADLLAKDIKQEVRLNWHDVRAIRAASLSGAAAPGRA